MNNEINIQFPHRKELYSKETWELYTRIMNETFGQLKLEFENGKK